VSEESDEFVIMALLTLVGGIACIPLFARTKKPPARRRRSTQNADVLVPQTGQVLQAVMSWIKPPLTVDSILERA
jgi:hypothetical protein